jgi:ATP-dependent helicase/nuclease subunit B
MEKYAGCAYAYFLKYGLSLEEREEYGIEAADLGNVYHGVLETFAGLLAGKGLDWDNFTDEQAEELINEAVEAEAARYTDALFFENEKNRYVADRMKKVMLRTVKTLAYQMKMGEFTPYEYEYEFEREVKTTDGKIKVKGKIDRLDIKKAEDKVLVKVMDYKSGKKEFSLMCFYYGVQLQMVVYMNGAVEKIAKEFPGKEMVPAAMLYYRIKDPIVDEVSSGEDSVIEQKINKELMLKGLVDDSDEVIISLDKSLAEGNEDKKSKAKSDVFANSSDTKSRADMTVISRFADKKAVQLTERMVSGDISIDPKEIRKSASTTEFDSCEYCEYAGVCGFDEHMPGYHKQLIKKEDDAVLLEKMKAEL